MVLQLRCALNMNSFAILQKNQDKRPVRATPTPFHLSPKTLSGRLKRICHLAKHVKQVWHWLIDLKTLLIFIWWNEPHPTLSLIFLTSCRSCPANQIQSWRILKGWQLTSISLCSSVYCWHPVTRRAEELGWQPEQSSFRKLILFVNISAAACSRTRSRCQLRD